MKPEFWSDDKITECSLSARLLFIGTWNFADDAGNLERSAKQIKARVFPADQVDCEPLIQELITHGLLTEYSVSEKKYLHIQNFAKHQKINRPSAPHCPVIDGSPKSSEGSVRTPRGKGRERKGRDIHARETARSPEFEAFWWAWPASARKQAQGACWEKWRKLGLDKHAAAIQRHVAAMKESVDWRKDGGEYIPAPLVYLNQRRWEGADTEPEQRELRVAL